MSELGALVERYETSNRRRAVKAAIMMVIGVPLLAFGAFTLVIFMDGPAGSNMAIAGGILGLGLGLMIFAIVFAVQAVWRRGEGFTLYEGGFVHSWRDNVVVVPWGDIGTVVDTGRNTAIARLLGGDFGCLVVLTSGRKIVINAFTDNAAVLVGHIREAFLRQQEAR
ncbi:hypothetical protein ABZX92_19725 [Lentzea sp. NPDC006480]|uniref:hypothetical protein n=1 Tax=Lentzea sp. NPDC006480 TaxID=3157176 RepID=UPI0033BB408A